MKCKICDCEIVERGGSYCLRCAALHATYSWDEIRIMRTKEEKAKREQTRFERG